MNGFEWAADTLARLATERKTAMRRAVRSNAPSILAFELKLS
jgi:hypothetical protein